MSRFDIESEVKKKDLEPEKVAEGKEEATKAKLIADPGQPTQDEIDSHEVAHCPFKRWCAHCVRGQASEDPHRRKTETVKEDIGDGQKIPIVAIDYCFMGSCGLVRDGEWKDGKGREADGIEAKDNPILTMQEDGAENIFAYPAQKKGAYEAMVKAITKDIDSLGYKKIVLKRDQETAIEELAMKITTYFSGEVIPERPPVGESQSNSKVERSIQTLGGRLRTLKDALEFKLKCIIPATHATMPWLVKWAAFTHNAFQHKRNGKTPIEMRRGRPFNKAVAGFGESVLYKERRDQKAKVDKLDVMWLRGIYLGVDAHAEETLIGTPEGVITAHSVRRLPKDMRWDKEQVLAVVGTPEEPTPGKVSSQPPISIRVDVESNVPPSEPVPRYEPEATLRAAPVYKKDYERFGYTEGCGGCRGMQSGFDRSTHHSKSCRQRMERLLKEDAVGRRRLEKADARHTGVVVREMEIIAEGTDDSAMQTEPNSSSGSKRRLEDDPTEPTDKRNKAAVVEPATRAAQTTQGEKRPLGEEVQSPMSDVQEPPTIPAGISMELNSLVMQRVSGLTQGEISSIIGKAMRGIDISEIYSPQRVVEVAKAMGLVGGLSMDITTCDTDGRRWDFSETEMRNRAIRHLIKDKPLLLIGSPMCTAFSSIQNINWGRSEARDIRMQYEYQKAVKHIEFVCRLYKMQMTEGRYFLHEHPQRASSWQLKCMKSLLKDSTVFRAEADMCQYRLKSRDKLGEGLVLKPTSFMTNSACIAQELSQKCQNKNGQSQHRHVTLDCGKTKDAAKYTRELCEAICQGLIRQKDLDRTGLMCMGEIDVMTAEGEDREDWKETEHDEDEVDPEFASDDVTGEPLDPQLVREARKLEIQYVHDMKLYHKVPRSECIKAGCKAITTRWIDVNKGDTQNKNYRSRLVAREIKKNNRPDLFAATPPLEALRLLVSDAATIEPGRQRKLIMTNDVSRAYFYAPAIREVYIEIPKEDWEEGDEDRVAKLDMSMYGTRDAAKNWQECYTSHLESIGFIAGVANPCLFVNHNHKLKTLVHGDDYVTTGSREGLKWMKGELEKKFKIKTSIIGSEEEDEKELKILNRIIRMTPKGIEYEADLRHAELISEEMLVSDSKGVDTPGVREDDKEGEDGESEAPLPKFESTQYRAIAARANYLAADRSDIQYAVKEICKKMSAPVASDWRKLKRLAKYLVKHPRMVQKYDLQEPTDDVRVYSDSDWAGCRKSRKSTSGGAIMIGAHCIRSWSKTQATIALSSAEAELVALVKATCEGIGMSSLLRDIGRKSRIQVYADASAALGIVSRKGIGKLRHLDTSMLWIQQKELRNAVEFMKVDGAVNPADLMTKNLAAPTASIHKETLRIVDQCGRAQNASNLR